MNANTDDSDIYKMLDRLKKSEVLNTNSLNGDEIYLLEKLVQMKLASKSSTSTSTIYFYGAKE